MGRKSFFQMTERKRVSHLMQKVKVSFLEINMQTPGIGAELQLMFHGNMIFFLFFGDFIRCYLLLGEHK